MEFDEQIELEHLLFSERKCRICGKVKNLVEDFLSTIVSSIKNEKKLKLSKFGTFSIRQKKSRIGRNPKTKETKVISSRDVVLFKPSKEFKEFVNLKDNG